MLAYCHAAHQCTVTTANFTTMILLLHCHHVTSANPDGLPHSPHLSSTRAQHITLREVHT